MLLLCTLVKWLETKNRANFQSWIRLFQCPLFSLFFFSVRPSLCLSFVLSLLLLSFLYAFFLAYIPYVCVCVYIYFVLSLSWNVKNSFISLFAACEVRMGMCACVVRRPLLVRLCAVHTYDIDIYFGRNSFSYTILSLLFGLKLVVSLWKKKIQFHQAEYSFSWITITNTSALHPLKVDHLFVCVCARVDVQHVYIYIFICNMHVMPNCIIISIEWLVKFRELTVRV